MTPEQKFYNSSTKHNNKWDKKLINNSNDQLSKSKWILKVNLKYAAIFEDEYMD